jgi:hypothetical protein
MIKKSLLKFLSGSIVTCLVLVACNKDDNPYNDKERKMMHNWRITNITVPKSGDPATDSTVLKTCMNDDLIKFVNSGFDFQDGTNKCDSSIFRYAKGSWSYKTAGDSIQLFSTNPAKYTAWKILVLNDSILQVKYTDSVVPTNKVTKTISFKH